VPYGCDHLDQNPSTGGREVWVKCIDGLFPVEGEPSNIQLVPANLCLKLYDWVQCWWEIIGNIQVASVILDCQEAKPEDGKDTGMKVIFSHDSPQLLLELVKKVALLNVQTCQEVPLVFGVLLAGRAEE